MNKIITLLFVASASILFSQVKTAPVKSKPVKAAGKTELARLITTRVVIRDTTTLKTLANNFDASEPVYTHISQSYLNYMEPSFFNEFKEKILEIAKSEKALVYTKWNLNKLSTLSERADAIRTCDSVKEYSLDANGNEVVLNHWICDSVSRISDVRAINFYETWYFNDASSMIEKEVLAYEILSYDRNKEVYRVLFTVVKDEASRKKLIRFDY